ncbi:phosphoribosylanthranilate isomerase [candidate division KSB1 bacterium]
MQKGLEKLLQPQVKLCGTTSVEDRRMAEEAGADYFGLVLNVPYSPRSCSLDEAKKIFNGATIPGVALLIDSDPDVVCRTAETLHPFALQLIGPVFAPDTVLWLSEKVDCQLWRSVHVQPKGAGPIDINRTRQEISWYKDAGADAVIVDTMVKKDDQELLGGTGVSSDWGQVREIFFGIGIVRFLAGGINPDNVARAVQTVRPDGIDLASGVESSPGKRDSQLVKKLMENLREKKE